MIQIEKNIPIPAITGRGRPKGSSAFATMEVGDSFVAIASRTNPDQGARAYFKRIGISARFVVRKQRDGSFRVWRIA